jgi:transposase InsO family protein
MPWKETGRVFERVRFIVDYLSGCFTISELAARYGVSRKTLYKWLARHDRDGLAGLNDRPRIAATIPQRTAAEVAHEIVAFKRRFPFMGPKKIIARLCELHPEIVWPAPSTAGELLAREGLVRRRKRRRPPVHPIRTRTRAEESNEVMTIDFKGHFRLGNAKYCYPLTIVDSFSRYILACDALVLPDFEQTRRVFERVFRSYGLPQRILSDNGSPFASPGLARLSKLSMWWVRLGIGIERIVPGRPEQNGAHERMHLTLKEQTTRPPARDHRRQQLVFDHFRQEYNEDRPHEALEQRRPASIYRPSPRPYPESLPAVTYPGHFETRRVAQNGLMRWKDDRIFVSKTLVGETIGLEEVEDGIWSVYYGEVLLARFDERERRFYG